MADNQQVPRFAILQYPVLHELELTITEYFLLDMIYHLSGSGSRWCNKKLENIAFDMRMTQAGVIKMRNRLIEKKLLIKGVGNRLKTSEKLNSVYVLDESRLKKHNSVSQKLNSVVSKTKLSIEKTPVENNKRITREKRMDNYPQAQAPKPIANGPGYASAMKKFEEIKRRSLDKMKPSYHA